MFHVYQPAVACTGKAQEGTKNLRDVCDRWPNANTGYPYGIYNCRLPSIHSEGRALDVGFPGVTDPEGTRLTGVLVEHAWELGLMGVIWDRRRWSARSPNGAPYTGVSPHTDHIHIEQTWDGARDHPLTIEQIDTLIFGDEMTEEDIQKIATAVWDQTLGPSAGNITVATALQRSYLYSKQAADLLTQVVAALSELNST